MEEGNYEQEEQQVDEMMDQKLSFLDSFLSEDKDVQRVEDNGGNETQEQTTCSGVNSSSSNCNCNCNSDNCDSDDVLLDKYIESECGLNKKTKAKTLKEMLLYHNNNKNIKRNKHELIESKYGFTTEHAIFTIAVMFVLLILYVLHLLYFVLIVLSFGVFVYMLHINKTTILKHKHKLIEYLQRKQTTSSYAYLHGSNMNELSEIQPDADNYYYDDEQTQTLIHI